ncbi:MAG: sigma-70 family RNA polymerase sigma factor [Spirulina sp. SIO3F2]|nr:sigma-70 family RNA polymerase sigma factor [Spirulina sp. SIO3F2]
MNSASLNRDLKQLALAAQAAPPRSRQRRLTLDQLIRTIQSSGQLCRPYRGQLNHLYEEIYDDATQRLFAHLCKKIDQYNPDYEVMQWANFLLKRRFFPAARKEFVPQFRSERDADFRQPWLNLDDVDKYPQLTPAQFGSPSLIEQVCDYIKTDPQGCLNKAHLRNHPEITFQVLALKILAGYKWQELSTELNIPISTMCSFYRKQLKTVAPTIKTYLTQ